MTDPITQHLADALREVVVCTEEWNEAVEAIIGRFPNTGIGLDRAKEALAAFDAAKEKPIRDIIAFMHTGGNVDINDLNRALAAYSTVKS